jgi:hypothetical protein
MPSLIRQSLTALWRNHRDPFDIADRLQVLTKGFARLTHQIDVTPLVSLAPHVQPPHLWTHVCMGSHQDFSPLPLLRSRIVWATSSRVSVWECVTSQVPTPIALSAGRSCRAVRSSSLGGAKAIHTVTTLAPRLFHDLQPTRARVRPPRAGLHPRRPGARRAGRGP